MLLLPACAVQKETPPKAHEIGAQIVLDKSTSIDEARGSASSGTVRAASIAEAATSNELPTGFQSFPYDRNARYRLRTAVGAPGAVALQPGETLVNYAASSSELWIIDAAQVDDQTRLLIEPTRADLNTHLLINTDRRTYLVEATSQQEGGTGEVLAWSYPHEQAAEVVDAVSSEQAEAPPPEPVEPEVKAFSWSEWFASLSPSSSQEPRGCRLCRDPDDHGDNHHGRDHDRGDHQDMHLQRWAADDVGCEVDSRMTNDPTLPPFDEIEGRSLEKKIGLGLQSFEAGRCL
ncbi:MAG: TrbG/VirB9 family P-type conjugative transfer protein [Rhizobiales bacterium]|nr:TrbG/VirB9 family P-type conjugative transfer protein [Hyphomicrobiales bacterium]